MLNFSLRFHCSQGGVLSVSGVRDAVPWLVSEYVSVQAEDRACEISIVSSERVSAFQLLLDRQTDGLTHTVVCPRPPSTANTTSPAVRSRLRRTSVRRHLASYEPTSQQCDKKPSYRLQTARCMLLYTPMLKSFRHKTLRSTAASMLCCQELPSGE